MEPMTPLEQALQTLRQELETAMSPLPGSRTGACWTADRATVSIALQLSPSPRTGDPDRFTVATDPGTALHHVTFELRRTPASLTADAPAPGVESAGQSPMNDAPPLSPLVSGLAEIFGTPGFDSSARATVFRETLEGLDDPQCRAVLESLGSPAPAGDDEGIARVRHRITRMAASGPAGRDRGPDLLRRLAALHSPHSLVQAAATHWRTPSDWATESGPID